VSPAANWGDLSDGEATDDVVVAVLGVGEGESAVDLHKGLPAGVAAVGLDEGGVDALGLNTFWCAIEKISPAQADLRLAEETYQQWRAELKFKLEGSPRLSQDSIFGLHVGSVR